MKSAKLLPSPGEQKITIATGTAQNPMSRVGYAQVAL